MLSRYLYIPLVFGLCALAVLYFNFSITGYTWLIIPLGIGFAFVYSLSEPIDEWWTKKKKITAPEGLKMFLDAGLPLYARMPEEEKIVFEEEFIRFQKNRQFIPMKMESVPQDVEAIICAYPVMFFHFNPDWKSRFKEYETVVVYRHKFPSPQFPKYMHASELYEEDKVLLFCKPHVVSAWGAPQSYFNVALYEWSKVALKSYLINIPTGREKFFEISGFHSADLPDFLGLPADRIDWRAVAMTYFLIFPHRFQLHLPDLYEKFKEMTRIDPAVFIPESYLSPG